MADSGNVQLPDFVSFTKTWHNKPYDYISPTRPELSMSGKNVVVAGGGSGIDKATAIAFAQGGAAFVSILSRRVERLQSAADEIRQAGPKTLVITESADFSQQQSAGAGLKSIAAQVGEIDIFNWSAGIMPAIGEVKGYGVDELRRNILWGS